MKYLTADYIFPIASPAIRNGIVILDESGFIQEVKAVKEQGVKAEYFEGIICPGFINSHCHLELSYLHAKTSEKEGLPQFIAEIDSLRRNFSTGEILKSIEKAEREMIQNGIVGVGDICNSDYTFKQKSKGNLRYHNFIEALGFHESVAEAAFEKYYQLYLKSSKEGLQSSITPHAPYSASDKLLEKIRNFAVQNNSILSIHNQESEDENLMFTQGKGKILERLKMLGLDTSQWKARGKNSVQSVMDQLPPGYKILLVHNTFTSREDLEFIKDLQLSVKKSSQITFCFCPTANLYIENKLPDFKIFLEGDFNLVVGTDSLASNHCLSVLEELKIISQNFPDLSLQTLLSWATINGARFFGWQADLGSIEIGKKPGINLIRNVNNLNLKFSKQSKVERIC